MMKRTIGGLFCFVFLFVCSAYSNADDSEKVSLPRLLQASIWRDFAPGSDDSRLLAAVDIVSPGGEPEAIEVTSAKERKKWISKLRFAYEIVKDKPEKGKRYHTTQGAPRWDVGEEVTVRIRFKKGVVKGDWLDAGTVIIQATH